MAGYGWSYLVVTMTEEDAAAPPGGVASPRAVAPPRWDASDASTFTSEQEMFRELGVTGWELVSIRETRGRVLYYFKRSRS